MLFDNAYGTRHHAPALPACNTPSAIWVSSSPGKPQGTAAYIQYIPRVLPSPRENAREGGASSIIAGMPVVCQCVPSETPTPRRNALHCGSINSPAMGSHPPPPSVAACHTDNCRCTHLSTPEANKYASLRSSTAAESVGQRGTCFMPFARLTPRHRLLPRPTASGTTSLEPSPANELNKSPSLSRKRHGCEGS